jgi:hypothetical protein
MAEYAVQLTSDREPAILGKVACVYAGTGGSGKSMELEQRATELAM